jgi:hypothetical protein
LDYSVSGQFAIGTAAKWPASRRRPRSIVSPLSPTYSVALITDAQTARMNCSGPREAISSKAWLPNGGRTERGRRTRSIRLTARDWCR